jgi:pyruvyl transferase EpsO
MRDRRLLGRSCLRWRYAQRIESTPGREGRGGEGTPPPDLTSEASRNATAALVARLRDEAHEAVASVVPPGCRCALLGHPNHANPGDQAIWLGAVAVLERLGVELVYECSWENYSRAALAGAIGSDGIILLAGGGNFGDVWPATHTMREAVLSEFVENRIVQLQQSIHFDDPGNRERTAALLRRHPDVTLIVRDRLSLEVARDMLGRPVLLAPDLAFACTLPALEDPPAVDILWVAREDAESRRRNPPVAPDRVLRCDWTATGDERCPLAGEGALPAAVVELIERNQRMTDAAISGHRARLDWAGLAAVRARLAQARLERGCRLLRRGRMIVTDRLHAHLFGLMLGIPTVVTDNSYGKVRGTFETFTAGAPLACWAETPEEALATGRRWLDSSG